MNTADVLKHLHALVSDVLALAKDSNVAALIADMSQLVADFRTQRGNVK